MSTISNPTAPEPTNYTSSKAANESTKERGSKDGIADKGDTEMGGIAEDGEGVGAKGKKRKRKEKPHILYSATFRKLSWSYFHLELVTPGTAATIPTSTSTSTLASTSTSTVTRTNENTNVPADAAISSTSSIAAPPLRAGDPYNGEEIAYEDIDVLTVSTLLQPPLKSFLGLTGSSIPIDILKTEGREVWIRIPRLDARAFRAALSGWTGVCETALVPGASSEGSVRVAWRVKGQEEWLGGLVGGGDGRDLLGS